MFCKKCGTELSDDTRFCPNCGEPIANSSAQQSLTDVSNEETASDNQSPNNDMSGTNSCHTARESKATHNRICCPECGSRDLQYSTETNYSTTVKTKGYSGGKGCLGYLLMGPFGLLCGSCGSGKSKTTVNSTTTHAWICKNCGNKFRTKEDILAAIHVQNSRVKTGKIMGIVLAIIFAPLVIYELYGILSGELTALIMLLATSIPFATCGILTYTSKNAIPGLQEELAETERKMARFLE